MKGRKLLQRLNELKKEKERNAKPWIALDKAEKEAYRKEWRKKKSEINMLDMWDEFASMGEDDEESFKVT